MPRVLFVALHRPDRSPCQRYRFEQYLDFLQKEGFSYDFSYLLSAREDKVFYSPGHYGAKLHILIKSLGKRFGDMRKAGFYDIVFVQREAFMLGSPFFEWSFSRRSKMIFDFDDAIWLPNVSEANRNLAWLKRPEKTEGIIRMADLVIAGNPYLERYARQFNKEVMVIPSTIDTSLYVPHPKVSGNRVCIGWTGSPTTIPHFLEALPALRKIKERFGDRIYFKIIGDPGFAIPELGMQGIPWRAESEVEDLREMDIGLMPLPDNPWTRGKCAMKGLQYMALGIPTLMSPVGVNREIIREGQNGFLPGNEAQWVEDLSQLIESPELREKIGKEGLKTVQEGYSVKANEALYLQAFQRALAS